MDEEGTGYEDSATDDSGYADDSGSQDTEASYDTSAYSDDAGYDASSDTGGDGGWGGFDPSSVTDSVTGGLGDAATSAWHAAGHLAHAGYDWGASTTHAAEAAGDAFIGDYDGTKHRMDQAAYEAKDFDSQLHQAGQDLWGN